VFTDDSDRHASLGEGDGGSEPDQPGTDDYDLRAQLMRLF
jgi:hypothetical protein